VKAAGIHLRIAKLCALTLLPLALTLGARAGRKPAAPAEAPVLDRKTPASEFVGADTCKSCHEAEGKSYDHGPHWKTEKDSRGISWQGCESCHGPGKAHADSPREPGKILRFPGLAAEQASRICLDCHETGEDSTDFARSQHMTSSVGCTSCHSEHKPKAKLKLLATSEPELCYGCHHETRPEFSRPFHDPVNEGLVQCSDCHNPHGGSLPKQLRSTEAQDQVCFKCHSEKSGPFVFEHAPVKTEGCMVCHGPIHGSSNPRLLSRANINLLCLECHTAVAGSAAAGPPSFHNQALKYQACTMCHTQIHGSNVDKDFFR
jgi:DmsE family decaheme c-type cytochrome